MNTQLETLRRYVANRPIPLVPEAPERVLVVGSGKGGVGTSTVAALLAVMAAADGNEVLLVDADESHGTLPLLLGAERRHPLAQLRGGEVFPSDLVVSVGHGLSLLPIGGTADPGDRVSPADRRALLRRVATLYGHFDLVVVDAGSRLEQVMSAANGAARLLAVTAAERISAAATYALVKTIDHHFPGLPVDLLFNRCRLAVGTRGFEEIDGATREFLSRGIDFAGVVPDDARLNAGMAEGNPLQDLAALGTPATSACHELVTKMTRLIDEGAAARLSRAQEISPAVAAPRISPRR